MMHFGAWKMQENWRISQYQVGRPELIVVLVQKDIIQARLVNQIEVWFNGVSVCRTMKSKGLEAEQHKSQ